MRRNLFWLSDDQWRQIEPLFADGRARQGSCGRSARDQRHPACSQERLPVVRLPAGVRPADDDLQSLRALGGAWRVGATVPRACRARPIVRDADDRLDSHQGAPLGLGRKKGEQKQAIGRSRGGRNTKIHAIADAKGRLLSILLSGGEAHDCPPAQRLIRRTKAAREASRRQGLRQRRAAAMAERSRHQARRSQQVEPQAALQLRQEILQTATPHRERLLPPQRLPPHRHALRQAGQKLPRLRLPRRCYRLVDFMSSGPELIVFLRAPRAP